MTSLLTASASAAATTSATHVNLPQQAFFQHLCDSLLRNDADCTEVGGRHTPSFPYGFGIELGHALTHTTHVTFLSLDLGRILTNETNLELQVIASRMRGDDDDSSIRDACGSSIAPILAYLGVTTSLRRLRLYSHSTSERRPRHNGTGTNATTTDTSTDAGNMVRDRIIQMLYSLVLQAVATNENNVLSELDLPDRWHVPWLDLSSLLKSSSTILHTLHLSWDRTTGSNRRDESRRHHGNMHLNRPNRNQTVDSNASDDRVAIQRAIIATAVSENQSLCRLVLSWHNDADDDAENDDDSASEAVAISSGHDEGTLLDDNPMKIFLDAVATCGRLQELSVLQRASPHRIMKPCAFTAILDIVSSPTSTLSHLELTRFDFDADSCQCLVSALLTRRHGTHHAMERLSLNLCTWSTNEAARILINYWQSPCGPAVTTPTDEGTLSLGPTPSSTVPSSATAAAATTEPIWKSTATATTGATANLLPTVMIHTLRIHSTIPIDNQHMVAGFSMVQLLGEMLLPPLSSPQHVQLQPIYAHGNGNGDERNQVGHSGHGVNAAAAAAAADGDGADNVRVSSSWPLPLSMSTIGSSLHRLELVDDIFLPDVLVALTTGRPTGLVDDIDTKMTYIRLASLHVMSMDSDGLQALVEHLPQLLYLRELCIPWTAYVNDVQWPTPLAFCRAVQQNGSLYSVIVKTSYPISNPTNSDSNVLWNASHQRLVDAYTQRNRCVPQMLALSSTTPTTANADTDSSSSGTTNKQSVTGRDMTATSRTKSTTRVASVEASAALDDAKGPTSTTRDPQMFPALVDLALQAPRTAPNTFLAGVIGQNEYSSRDEA